MMQLLCFVWLSVTVVFGGGRVFPTPHGYRPSQCVHKIEEMNHVIRKVDLPQRGVIVEYPDSHRKLFYPELAECVSNAQQIFASMKQQYSKPYIYNNSNKFNNGGWVLYGYEYTPNDDSTVHSFYADYILPNESPDDSNQILYYFTGLTDMSDNNETILQPVIAYCGNGECGFSWYNKGWMGASWNCCPNGMSWYTDSITLNQGSTVSTNIQCNNKNGYISVSMSYEKNTNVSLNLYYDDRMFNFATVTLEAYDYKNCNNLNSKPFIFDNMKLMLNNGNEWMPQWTQVNHLQDCNGSIQFDDNNLYASIIGTGQ